MYSSPHNKASNGSLSVCFMGSKEGGVVLDVHNDRILKLNPTGAEMWSMLAAGMSDDEVVQHFVEKYQVEETTICESLQRLLRSASDLGVDPRQILIPTRPETDTERNGQDQINSFPWYGQNNNDCRPKARRLLVLKAILGLAWFDVMLSFRSFEVVCRHVKGWPLRPQERDIDSTCIGEVCSAVERACIWYPKRAVCLQRSAVTACLLRNQGIAAQMVVGVRSMPLLAHAWVEAEGCVVNDWPRVRRFYPRIAAY